MLLCTWPGRMLLSCLKWGQSCLVIATSGVLANSVVSEVTETHWGRRTELPWEQGSVGETRGSITGQCPWDSGED